MFSTVTRSTIAGGSSVAAISFAAVVLSSAACGSSPPPAPDPPGTLEIVTATRGERLDPDGYAIHVDGGVAGRGIATSGRITIANLQPDVLGVELTGQSSNCTVIGDNPRVVSIESGRTTRTTFELVCGEISVSALTFDGSAFAYAGDAPAFDLTDTWTIEAWIKPADLSVVEQHLVSKWGAGLVGAWSFYIRDRRLQVSTRIDPKNTTGGAGSDLVEGKWQHVAATFSNGAGRIYVDGELDAAFTGLNVPQITATPVTVGYVEAFVCCFFVGEIDEVRIWGVERSPQEILGAMNRQLLGDEPGLRVYWRLDDASGDTANSATGSGLDLRLGSAAGVDPSDPTWSGPGEPQER